MAEDIWPAHDRILKVYTSHLGFCCFSSEVADKEKWTKRLRKTEVRERNHIIIDALNWHTQFFYVLFSVIL